MEYQFGNFLAYHIMTKPVGSLCNLDCTYCYYLEKSELYGNKYKTMSDSVLENYIKQYIESQNAPIVTFSWQGGEPTLAGIEFFKKVIGLQHYYSQGKSIINTFQTNGTLLTEDWCRFLGDHKFLVGISIDGPEELHNKHRLSKKNKGTWREVMQAIELMHRFSVDFNTLTTINNINSEYALPIYNFLKNIGSRYMQFLPVVEHIAENRNDSVPLKLAEPDYDGETKVAEWSVDAKKYGNFLVAIFDEWVHKDIGSYFVQIFDATLANYLGERPGICLYQETCGDALALEHNGDVYSCDHFVFPKHKVGNITTDSLLSIAGSEIQRKFGLAKKETLPTVCLNCEVRFLCHGECPKHRIISAPNGEAGLNYLCKGLKHFFKHTMPYMQRMAELIQSQKPPALLMNEL